MPDQADSREPNEAEGAAMMQRGSTVFQTVVADPPWPYETSRTDKFAIPRVRGQRSVEEMGYDTMSMEELRAIEISAADDAHLYLWTTNAFMVEAHDLARAWGFEPKTICTWVKVQPDGRPSMKTGYYFRGATEHFLFCVRGSLRLQVSEGLPTAYMWPRLPHSVKPDAFYDLVEHASPGPYAELFARRARFGWEYPIGNQALGGIAA